MPGLTWRDVQLGERESCQASQSTSDSRQVNIVTIMLHSTLPLLLLLGLSSAQQRFFRAKFEDCGKEGDSWQPTLLLEINYELSLRTGSTPSSYTIKAKLNLVHISNNSSLCFRVNFGHSPGPEGLRTDDSSLQQEDWQTCAGKGPVTVQPDCTNTSNPPDHCRGRRFRSV